MGLHLWLHQGQRGHISAPMNNGLSINGRSSTGTWQHRLAAGTPSALLRDPNKTTSSSANKPFIRSTAALAAGRHSLNKRKEHRGLGSPASSPITESSSEADPQDSWVTTSCTTWMYSSSSRELARGDAVLFAPSAGQQLAVSQRQSTARLRAAWRWWNGVDAHARRRSGRHGVEWQPAQLQAACARRSRPSGPRFGGGRSSSLDAGGGGSAKSARAACRAIGVEQLFISCHPR